ncbi:transposase [Streptomyces sp. ALB3]|uniref:transposase n=1 Tax=Streptomyces sp. ALB3 TaxID=3374278 RepID=UPI003796784F
MWRLRARVVPVDMGRGDLSDAEWERPRPFLPVSNGRCGRWRNHRQVIDGILYRVRTGVQWRDLPAPKKAVYERHRLWSADGTGERLLQQDVTCDTDTCEAGQHPLGPVCECRPMVPE